MGGNFAGPWKGISHYHLTFCGGAFGPFVGIWPGIRLGRASISFSAGWVFAGVLQWLAGYLGLVLVFVWGGTQRGGFNFCFSRVFC